jgi:CheY-like chemotaxis protein
MSSPLSILVIDDDPVMRELLEALLGVAGHHVRTVESGEQALTQLTLTAVRPDVVLTDLHMPGLQGHALATALLAARQPGTVLVGMSGSFPTEGETHLLDQFLQKPFTPEQFEHAVVAARSSHPEAPAAAAQPAAAGVLDEGIFTRLAETLAPDQLRTIYAMTLDDVRSRLASMQASAHAEDLAAVRREAHAIKGGTGMVGATELYHLAAAAEQAESTNALPLDDFVPACDRLQRMLDERFKAPA